MKKKELERKEQFLLRTHRCHWWCCCCWSSSDAVIDDDDHHYRHEHRTYFSCSGFWLYPTYMQNT